jgi:hypothetical protein
MVLICDRNRKGHSQCSGPTKSEATADQARKHFFSQRVVEGWNSSPADLKLSVSVKSFKNGYRTFREKMVERT